MLKAYIVARHVNLHSGGAVIAPWDMLDGYELEDWAFAAVLLSDVPSFAGRQKAINGVFEKARQNNKDYRNLTKRKIH